MGVNLLYLVYDSLECLGIVHSEVSEHLTVDLYTCLVNQAHELRVRETLDASGCVDTLNPESAEVALFLLTVAVCVGKTLLPGVLCYCPYIATATIVTAGKLKDFLSLGT